MVSEGKGREWKRKGGRKGSGGREWGTHEKCEA